MKRLIKRLFRTKGETKPDNQNVAETEKLQKIWDSLDPDLQECAKKSFGLGHRNLHVILNERGMINLIQHLEEHGFEITKKDNTR